MLRQRAKMHLLQQRGHLIEWVPVCLAVGIGTYFALRFEPVAPHFYAMGLAIIVFMVVARFVGEAFAPLSIALVLVATGFLLAAQRAHDVAGPILGFRYYGPIEGRVINLSSAAQATVDLRAMAGEVRLPDGAAYAQSKLALTMWSRSMGLALAESGPMVVSVNPGSLLGTKMVKEAFGHVRADVSVGADILVRAALSPEFASASGEYFDNDAGRFAPPHPDALDPALCAEVVATIDRILKDKAVEQEEGR